MHLTRWRIADQFRKRPPAAGLVALSEDATLATLATGSRTRIFERERETNGWKLTKSIPDKSTLAHFSPDHRWLAVAQQSDRLHVAWVGANVATLKRNSSIRVYRSTWENPRWDVPIHSIDFVSSKTACGPSLLAITIETAPKP